MLILVGSGVIAFAANRSLIHGPELENLGIGIVVIGSARWPTSRSELALPPCAQTSARRWRATPPTCAPTRIQHRRPRRPRSGQRDRRGAGWTRSSRSSSPSRSWSPAPASPWARCACSSTRRCPTTSCAIRDEIEAFAARGVVGYHELRTRPRARAATSTCTSSSAPARRSRRRTAPATSSRTRSSEAHGADVLIHLEPEDRVRPGRDPDLRTVDRGRDRDRERTPA